MVKGVLFDLYETLVTERGTSPVRASSLGPRLGLDPTAFRHAWKSQRPRVIRGELSLADALSHVGRELGRPADPAIVHRICLERVREKATIFGRMDPAAVRVLRHLRLCGVKLAVVSNCCAEDVEAWPRCAAASCMNASVFSFEIGAAKPDREIYAESLRRLGVASRHAVFIGDGGDDELAGAERAGLRAANAAWYRGDVPGMAAHVPRLPTWQSVLELATAD